MYVRVSVRVSLFPPASESPLFHPALSLKMHNPRTTQIPHSKKKKIKARVHIIEQDGASVHAAYALHPGQAECLTRGLGREAGFWVCGAARPTSPTPGNMEEGDIIHSAPPGGLHTALHIHEREKRREEEYSRGRRVRER